MVFIVMAMVLLAAFTFVIAPMADVNQTTGDTMFPSWFVDSKARLLILFIFAAVAVFAFAKLF